MIIISPQYSAEYVVGLRVSGHAKLSKPGTDVLCAAVSFLTENLGDSLRVLLNTPLDIEEADGLYHIRLKGTGDPRTDLLFQSVILGLRRLAEHYPERIRIETGD